MRRALPPALARAGSLYLRASAKLTACDSAAYDAYAYASTAYLRSRSRFHPSRLAYATAEAELETRFPEAFAAYKDARAEYATAWKVSLSEVERLHRLDCEPSDHWDGERIVGVPDHGHVPPPRREAA